MHVNRLIGAYFSPTHNSEKYIRQSLTMIDLETKYIDLTQINNREKVYHFNSDDLLVIALPVYGGRIPQVNKDILASLKGNDTPAIIFVTYGNRDFDDALIELYDKLTENGFNIQGAGALIGQHTYSSKVAYLRPTGEDIIEVKNFISAILKEDLRKEQLILPGNRPYKTYNKSNVTPINLDQCIKCGKCIKSCPTKAIAKDYSTDSKLCITCNKCVKECPMEARILPEEFSCRSKEWLESNFIERKENMFFK